MSDIRLLPKNISDKIAAGEVVERPASVVKELVENAIDAKASAVSISISGGGIKDISVTDNGTGISSGDVGLAFEKHATSKLYTLSDLDFIATQGFRGEALSSIAAVSIAEMKTKRREEEAGTHIRISAGRIDYIKPVGIPDGTSISVSNLFYNVPARKNFLKKEAQEAAYVSDLVSRFILAFPEISFHYSSDGKTIYHSPGNGDLLSAIYCVYGDKITDTIVYVEHKANDISVSGYVSRPGTVMKNRRAGSVFVNRRYVRNTFLHDMIKSAYGETLVKGDVPFFVLNLDVALSSVDVNVHPNKLQVRFRDSAAVEYVIKEAVSGACREVRGSVNVVIPKELPQRSVVEMRATEDMQQEFFQGFKAPKLEERESPITRSANAYVFEDNEEEAPVNKDTCSGRDIAFETDGYRLIGSLGDTYVLVEQGGDLLIIDQHAAHERLLYEKFKSSAYAASQTLLEPCVITVSHEQKNLLEDNMQAFIAAGFDIEPFGALEYKISSVPFIAAGAPAAEIVNEALGGINGGGDIALKRKVIIRAACRSAVKAGDKLSEAELKSLADSFLKTGIIPTCPHGRPVILVITKKQLEKSFKRVI